MLGKRKARVNDCKSGSCRCEMGIGMGILPNGDFFVKLDLPEDACKKGYLAISGKDADSFLNALLDGAEQVKAEHNIP